MNITKNYTEKELTLSVEGRIDTITSQELQKKLKTEDIPMVIKNVNDAVGEIFRMSGFDKVLKIE